MYICIYVYTYYTDARNKEVKVKAAKGVAGTANKAERPSHPSLWHCLCCDHGGWIHCYLGSGQGWRRQQRCSGAADGCYAALDVETSS